MTDDARPLPVVDMSPAAIERRLSQVGALYHLMLSLGTAALAATRADDVAPGTMGPTGSRR